MQMIKDMEEGVLRFLQSRYFLNIIDQQNVDALVEVDKIIDSIKRVNQFISSIREVLPGRDYFIPETTKKLDPFSIPFNSFQDTILKKPMPISKAIYTSITGISPLLANELCCRASLDSSMSAVALGEAAGLHLFRNFERMMEDIKDEQFMPHIIYQNGAPIEFSSLPLKCYENYEIVQYPSASKMLESYYATKSTLTRMHQKSADLRKVVSNAIDRESKKYDLQLKQLKDTEKRDKYKVYGELITTYGYELEPGAKELKSINYYNNEEICIPLDPTLSPIENAKRYFEKYNKLKRTYEALTKLIQDTADELTHLESIRTSLEIATDEEDLAVLKQELMEYGYMKRKLSGKAEQSNRMKFKKSATGKSKPFHYISSDGYHIYVGKNNFQNDELTFQFAEGGDWWFHAKKIAGSHVIVKAGGQELPDRTFEEAARLAAYYSSARDSDKVEIDYTLRKNIKKPSGGKPGFVVYYTNYSMIASTDISGIEMIP